MNVETNVTHKDGVYTLTLSYNDRVYGQAIATYIQVKDNDPVNLLDMAKVLITEIRDSNLKAVKSVEI